jgi:type IV pilus assembly protein PilM
MSAVEVMTVASRVTGLDIATTCVRAAELSYGKDHLVLERFSQMPLPVGAVEGGEVKNPAAVAAAIKLMWKRGNFKAKQVAIGVASQRVVVRQLEIPYVPAQERRQTLPLVVGDQIPLPVEEAVMDFVSLDTLQEADGNAMSRGLLVAAAEAPVMTAIEAVELAGLRVTDVDLTPFAVLRSLCNADPMGLDARIEAIIDVGASVTSLVLHRNGIPQFVRILQMGGHDITERLMDDLGVDLPTAESLKREAAATDLSVAPAPETPAAIIADAVEALVEEIRGSLDYYMANDLNESLARIVLTGGGSLVPGLVGRLEGVTQVPVERGRSLMNLGAGRSGLTDDHLVFADPMAAAAVGLAVRSK